MSKPSFITRIKYFFKQKWVLHLLKGIGMLMVIAFLFGTDVYEENILQLKGSYGKKRLFILLLYKMDQYLGKSGSCALMIVISSIFFFLAFKEYKKTKA